MSVVCVRIHNAHLYMYIQYIVVEYICLWQLVCFLLLALAVAIGVFVIVCVRGMIINFEFSGNSTFNIVSYMNGSD